MRVRNKQVAQRLIAIVVIVAILDVVGVSPAVLVFFLVGGFIVWRTVRRSEHQETWQIFEFYVCADEVLRDEARQWYGFEIAEVIDSGERVQLCMPDPPPLSRFALGALYHRAGDCEAAVEHLAWVVENEQANEARQTTPSPRLRHYVEELRRIEREPVVAPQTLAAVRNLERRRQRKAAEFLADSRQKLKDAASASRNVPHAVPSTSSKADERTIACAGKPLSAIIAPPPIAEVLRDIYQPEEKRA